MTAIKIALVGLGKIARDQHIPAMAADPAFELVAVASPHHRLSGLPNFSDLPALLREVPDTAAVALCTPPQVRYDIARYALEHGLHVLLEKPPGVTVSTRKMAASVSGVRTRWLSWCTAGVSHGTAL